MSLKTAAISADAPSVRRISARAGWVSGEVARMAATMSTSAARSAERIIAWLFDVFMALMVRLLGRTLAEAGSIASRWSDLQRCDLRSRAEGMLEIGNTCLVIVQIGTFVRLLRLRNGASPRREIDCSCLPRGRSGLYADASGGAVMPSG